MKKILALAVFVIGFSASAHAQAMSLNGGAASNNGGGAAMGGGLSKPIFPSMPINPPTHFNVSATSGTDADFEPSSFLTFEEAVAAGRAAQTKPQTIVEAAAENKSTDRPKAKFELVQDDNGKAVITRR